MLLRKRVKVLSADLDVVTTSELTAIVTESVRDRRRIIVGHHNLHSLRLLRQDSRLRAFYARSDVTHIDGMALVFVSRSLGLDVSRKHRTTYVDWFPQLLALAERNGWRVFYLGGSHEVQQLARTRIASDLPLLTWEGMEGYFDLDGEEDRKTVDIINSFNPDLLFVGMGMPRQELWTLANTESLGARVTLMAGGCLDYFAGAVATPPRWLGRLGLEWLFRLATQPRRLFHRYLVEPWALLWPYLVDQMRRIPKRHQST